MTTSVRCFLLFVLFLALLACGAESSDADEPPADPAAPAAPPNVILYLIDGAGADLMSLYGYERKTTPNLERLAREGTTFEHAYSNSGWTKPSTATLMTSLHHSVLGGFADEGDQIPRQAITMAQHFHRADYRTAVFTSNPFACRLSGLDRDVDEVHDRHVRHNSASSASLHRQFFEWRDARPDAPYWVHFQTTDVHEPHDPPEPFAGLFVTPEQRTHFDSVWRRIQWFRGGRRGDNVLGTYRSRLLELGEDPREFFEIQRGLYDECMVHNDSELGKLIATLKERGEWGRTLLIPPGASRASAAVSSIPCPRSGRARSPTPTAHAFRF